MWPLSACHFASSYKISLKSDNRLMSYGPTSNFQYGCRPPSWILKIKKHNDRAKRCSTYGTPSVIVMCCSRLQSYLFKRSNMCEHWSYKKHQQLQLSDTRGRHRLSDRYVQRSTFSNAIWFIQTCSKKDNNVSDIFKQTVVIKWILKKSLLLHWDNTNVHCVQKKTYILYIFIIHLYYTFIFSCITFRKSNLFEWKFQVK